MRLEHEPSLFTAPVKAPAEQPKSSDSTRLSVDVVTSTALNGPSLLGFVGSE
ncbi:MAG: hypothetical protein U0166_20850 [Acidobacteriota bacterium]